MKRVKVKYQVLFIFSIAFFATAIIYSQTKLQGKTGEELKEAVKETTEMWIQKLALNPQQAKQMEEKIFEFAGKKNRLINSKMREEAKIEKLRILQRQEYEEIEKILTQSQFGQYLALSKKRIKRQ